MTKGEKIVLAVLRSAIESRGPAAETYVANGAEVTGARLLAKKGVVSIRDAGWVVISKRRVKEYYVRLTPTWQTTVHLLGDL
jgi:hypothetical protein